MAPLTRLFISHAHADDARALELRTFLRENDRRFACSVVLRGRRRLALTGDALIEHVLAPRIRWSQAVVVLLSPAALASEWVRWEVHFAHSCGRPVLVLPLAGVLDREFHAPFDIGTVVNWDAVDIATAARRPPALGGPGSETPASRRISGSDGDLS